MLSEDVSYNRLLIEYEKKYRHNKKLHKYTKEQVRDFDIAFIHYHYEYSLHDYVYHNQLLKGRKWWLIGDTYYEVPKTPSWNWFKNLKASTQIATGVLLTAGITSAIVFPVLSATLKNTVEVSINKEVEKYVDIDFKDKAEVGKPLKTEFTLKESAQEDKQLPKKLKVVKTGDVVLPEYNKPTTFSKGILQSNEEEPENYYTYTLVNRDKADLYIKKVLGPISIEMEVDERKYNVTFDPNNGDDKQVVEVKSKGKVAKPTDPSRLACAFKFWADENSSEEFNFDTLINKDITLKAHYQATQTCVIIRGINGLNSSYPTMQAAYDAGNTIMKGLNTDLTWGTCSKEKYLQTFNDVTIDKNGYYNADITWELYTKDDEELVIPSVRDEFFYSFGRATNCLGDSSDGTLFLHNTKVIGVTDNKPKLKYEASDTNCRIMTKNTQRSSKELENPFTFKNIKFDDSLVDTYLILQTASPMDYYLTVDGCEFINRLCVDGSNKHITIKNCVFNGENSPNAYGLELWSGSGAEKSDYLVFENNIVKKYKRGIQLNCSTLGYASIKGNKFLDTNPDKKENGAVQFSCGTNTVFDVVGNTFYNCLANCFKIHENFKEHGILNINDNVIDHCGYVGIALEPKSNGTYTLNSANNIITGTTKDKAGVDVDKEEIRQDYIVILNEKH